MYNFPSNQISERKMFKGQLFIILAIFIQNSSCTVESLYWIGEKVWELYSIVNDIRMVHDHDANEVYDLFTDASLINQEIRIHVNDIHKRLDRMEKFINSKTINASFGSSSNVMMLNKCVDTIERSVLSIDEAYNEFNQHMDPRNPHSDNILRSLTRNIILEVEGKIEVIRKIITDATDFLSNGKTLLTSISDVAVDQYEYLCDNQQIISNNLVHLFTIVMIAELKVNVMLIFVNMYRYIQSEGWKTISLLAREQFEKQFAIYVNVFRLHTYMARNSFLRRCDPEEASRYRDRNYIEIEGAIQTTIFRYDRQRGSSYSCNSIWFQYPDYCKAVLYDIRSACLDTPADCAWLDSVDACVLNSGPYKFQYVNSTAKGFLGKKSECSADRGYKIKDWSSNTAVCACNCYGYHNLISAILMESNVLENRVITGLRFIRKNNILHIQPREGTLLANGFIRQEGDGWLPIAEYVESYLIEPKNEVCSTVFLDDLNLHPGYILTGVKFNKVKRGTLTGFAIEIFGTLFNYKTGKLDLIHKKRISRRVIDNNAGNGLSFRAISSLNNELPHKLSPRSIQYVTLKRSELKADFGQSTLPLFDAAPLITNPPSVLRGVGIFHEGREGYAGFISLRVYGIPYHEYFSDFERMYVKNDTVLFNTSHHEERELVWIEPVKSEYVQSSS